MGWKNIVIKPAISAAAFQTFKIVEGQINANEELFQELIKNRDMLVQPFFSTISELGEASLMIFDGKFSHAILKKAKKGDFRVQDDFGGTVHDYSPSKDEVAFALKVFKACDSMPLYGRADIVWDQKKNIYLSELEIIEPELWLRNHPKSAESIAEAVFMNI
jgi:glutathione synthase/RimK-type ligase-like ATP-grasp enzyme